jgi:hypothetical protein
MTTLIVPCAGKSTRYGTDKPKYMLTHPNGRIMAAQSIIGIDLTNINKIIYVLVADHLEKTKFNKELFLQDIIKQTGKQCELFILSDYTSCQAETIYKTIIKCDVNGSMFIKDVDNYFNVKPMASNSVCVSYLKSYINPVNKSYVDIDKDGKVSSIVEKQVINNRFCVGGYSFFNAKEFIVAYKALEKIKQSDELYISHIIQWLCINNDKFYIQEVSNYVDLGTLEDWKKYVSQYKTVFIDLDGCILFNSSRYNSPAWGETGFIPGAKKKINELYDSGKAHIIITTARPEEIRQLTEEQLLKNDIKYHRLIMGLPHAQRIIINDYSKTNPYPSASAINIPRDQDNLQEIMNGNR